MSMGEAVRRIAEAEKQLKAGNIDEAIRLSPCPECKEKMRKMKEALEDQP
jgi:hypothetical protein